MSPDDERLGELFTLLRHQNGMTQQEVALATSIPVRDINRIENGRAGDVLVGRVRRLFIQLEARARITVSWRGAAADRLLDARQCVDS